MEGYRAIHMAAYNVAAYLTKEISKLGDFEFIASGDPEKDIPAACFHFKNPKEAPYNLYELSDRLRMRGWQVPAFSLPANVQETVVMRVMVRQGFTMDMARLLIEDMKHAICHLKKYKSTQNMSEGDGMAFKHT